LPPYKLAGGEKRFTTKRTKNTKAASRKRLAGQA
jgi:hypothetical protein